MEQTKRLETSDQTTAAVSVREDSEGNAVLGTDVHFDVSDLGETFGQPAGTNQGPLV